MPGRIYAGTVDTATMVGSPWLPTPEVWVSVLKQLVEFTCLFEIKTRLQDNHHKFTYIIQQLHWYYLFESFFDLLGFACLLVKSPVVLMEW